MRELILTSLEDQILYILSKIKRDTQFSSSTADCIKHPLYQVLLNLKDEPEFIKQIILHMQIECFTALSILRNVVDEEVVLFKHRGYVSKMINDWYLWAEKNNIFKLEK